MSNERSVIIREILDLKKRCTDLSGGVVNVDIAVFTAGLSEIQSTYLLSKEEFSELHAEAYLFETEEKQEKTSDL